MAAENEMFPSSDAYGPQRPVFHIGKHESAREGPFTDLQYGSLLNQGVSRSERRDRVANV